MNSFKIAISKQILIKDCSKFTATAVRSYADDKIQKGDYYTGEKNQDWNILKVFSSKKNSFLELHRYGPFQASTERLKMWFQKLKRDADLLDQRYIEERHSVLGNDLATAHFLVFRGGKVKFVGHSDWIAKEKDDDKFDALPIRFTEGWLLEAIDASGLPLRYESFQNFKQLYELKSLTLRNCPNVDDWCVDRISGEFQNTLEHLDLSGCHRVTENSLSCIYRLKNLKTLVLNDIVTTNKFQLSCLLLEDVLPNLNILGVKYINSPKEYSN